MPRPTKPTVGRDIPGGRRPASKVFECRPVVERRDEPGGERRGAGRCDERRRSGGEGDGFDAFVVAGVVELEFGDGPGDGFEVGGEDAVDGVLRAVAGEGDVGGVVVAFEVLDGAEFGGEVAVEAEEFGALDGEVDEGAGAAMRVGEDAASADADFEGGGGVAEGGFGSLGGAEVVAAGVGVEAFEEEGVVLADAVEADEGGAEVADEGADLAGKRGVQAVHASVSALAD